MSLLRLNYFCLFVLIFADKHIVTNSAHNQFKYK